VIFADRLKDLGYEQATQAGISIGIKDMVNSAEQAQAVEEANARSWRSRTSTTRVSSPTANATNKVVDIWAEVTTASPTRCWRELGTQEVRDPTRNIRRIPSFNPIFMMAIPAPAARRSRIRQLAACAAHGEASGEIIENAITANFARGSPCLQYFILDHGARKGSRHALKTANSGYLNAASRRRAQDSIITEQDWGRSTASR